MHPVLILAEILAHAADLLALAIAPPLLSPAPPPPTSPIVAGVIAAVLLVALLLGAARLRARLVARDALVGTALLVVAVVAAVACAAVFRGARAPVGRGVLFVGVPLWIGLALVARVVAARRFGASSPRAGLTAAVIVGGAGALLLAASAGWLSSPEKMWWDALRKDGGNIAAVDALVLAAEPTRVDARTGEVSRTRDHAAVMRVLDQCIAAQPDACACHARRADAEIRSRAAELAVADARAASTRCPADVSVRTTLAAALAYHGDGELAEQEARAGLQKSDDPRLHYALALAYDREGRRAEAMTEAKLAVDRGAGRDAGVLLAALAINAGDLDVATKVLTPLVAADPGDAEAQYDLALVADKQDHFNAARQGYLAALRADKQLADARYNVALLTLRHGIIDEARHHAKQFREAFPNDPRNASLGAMVSAVSPKK